METVLTSVVDL